LKRRKRRRRRRRRKSKRKRRHGLCWTAGMTFRHQELIAWKRADDLYIDLHSVTRRLFPTEERYELSAQLRRAGFSVAANIAEGFSRTPGRDRLKFLRISDPWLRLITVCTWHDAWVIWMRPLIPLATSECSSSGLR
jgi:hypothetical protein